MSLEVSNSPVASYNQVIEDGTSLSDIDIESNIQDVRMYCWDWVFIFPLEKGKKEVSNEFNAEKFANIMLGLRKKSNGKEIQDALRIVLRTTRCFISQSDERKSLISLSKEQALLESKQMLCEEFKDICGGNETTEEKFSELIARAVTRRIQLACGLTTKLFYSFDHDEIILLVKADDEDLRTEADRTDYRMQTSLKPFDSTHSARNHHLRRKLGDTSYQESVEHLRLVRGTSTASKQPELDPKLFSDGEKYHLKLHRALSMWGHNTLADSPSDTSTLKQPSIGLLRRFYNALVYIPWDPKTYFAPYASYLKDEKYQPYFRWYPLNYKLSSEDTLFRGVDRIRLSRSIMERHIGLDALEEQGYMTGQLSLHDLEELEDLKRTWALNFTMITQPIGRIRDYFGEKIALYFAWLEFYTKMLVLPSLFGIVVYILDTAFKTDGVRGKNEDSKYYLIVFSVFIVIWSTLFTELWKRKTAIYNTLWGVTEKDISAFPRTQFLGIHRNNPVTDEIEMWHQSQSKRRKKISTSCLVIAIMIMIVITALAGLFLLKHYFQEEKVEYGNQKVSVLNAIQIMVLNMVYRKIAMKLNDWENHRTDAEYENFLITKVFLFQFVNSFSSFFYIAFVKSLLPGSSEDNVLDELQSQLAILFSIRILVGNCTEILVPYIKYRIRIWQEMRHSKDSLTKKNYDPAEQQAKLNPYESMESFEDYNEMVIQYGFVTLFVVAFPLTPLLALINNVAEVHVDAFKLCVGHRRPYPHLTKDIGSWFYFLRFMSNIAIVTNTAIILFTTDMFDTSATTKWLIFLAVEQACLLLKLLVESFVHDIPPQLELLNERFEHIEAMVFKGLFMDDDGSLCEVSEALDDKIYPNPAFETS